MKHNELAAQMNKLNCMLLALFAWLQYSLWLGKNGIYDLISTHNTIILYKNINNIDQMRARNNQLLYEIYDLLHGYEAIEERSRYDLGMIKLGETFYLPTLYSNVN
ncbi:septum formation initiator family protein [Blochmannia endosymbiont of Camponotus sp. C-003]|uniref:septum formation initiator family protein n=1 Tax=unclassified Candidatus Blochmanniella TaxID=711328 RepID=UPI0020255CDF|nr:MULTISPECIES: septum formation initiator family protein [unclassified Candidatus Blochmannia]URJ23079.1 septum formation initiator family protein [Blochmannia endosymbiont of Camponotus sp. C-003]URJ28546.1 septum formation initiator family protein [Blochmannia endosymbiont of Camponotus sp. C-046]